MPKLVDIHQGTTTLHDYRGFYAKDYPNYSGPAVVFMSEWTMRPGDVSPWHYHDGLVYVVIEKGTVIGDDGCGRTETYHAGDGWIELPHQVHRVINKGPGELVGYWVTMYPAKARPMEAAAAPTCK